MKEAKPLIEELAAERGYTLETLAEEIARRGYPKHKAQAALFGEGLEALEMYQLSDALVADVAASFGRTPPPRVAPPRH